MSNSILLFCCCSFPGPSLLLCSSSFTPPCSPLYHPPHLAVVAIVSGLVFCWGNWFRCAGDTPVLDVGGGTGWACQWYADRFEDGGEDPDQCRLYFYDDAGPPWALQDETTKGKWSCWDVRNQRWAPVALGSPPSPDGLYAGIGARQLSEGATCAIGRLYDAPAQG